MPDSAKIVVRCSGCGIRLLVKAVTTRRSLCPQCASKTPTLVTHRSAPLADDDQIVAWLLEGDPNTDDE